MLILISILLATYFFFVCILDTFLSGFTIYFYVFKKTFLVYSLNFVLCLHLAINSLLLFNNLSGNLCVKICIFSSKHKLHLPSKLFAVFDFFVFFLKKYCSVKNYIELSIRNI